MKKTLIALAVIANSPIGTAFADNNSDETLVVTASRTTQEKFDVLAPVDVFDREAIDTINPESLAQLLDRVAGISTTTTGTAANNTSLFVRGGNSDHVLVLIDGVRVGSATLGQKGFGDIPVQMIERVEVIRGPRAALWGSDAIGGVIQIFTRKLGAGQGVAGLEFGSESLWKVHGGFGFGNDQHQYTVAASASKSDGFDVLNPDSNNQTDEDGYDKKSFSLNGQSQINDMYRLGLSAQIDKGTTEFDTGFGGDEITFDNHFVQLSNIFALEQATVELKLATSADKNHDNADKLFADSTVSRFETERDQVNLMGNMPVNDNLDLTAGIDWYKESVAGHTAYSETERTAKAAYLVGRGEFDRIKLEGSIRRDEIGETEAETTTQFAVGYQFSDNLLVSFSQGSAFKAPTFNDLYWPDNWGSVGNPDLKSELADNQELMLRYRSDAFSAEFSVYQTDYENLIEWQYNPDTQYSTPTNVANAKIKGAEATVTFTLGQLHNRVSLAHIDAKNEASGSQLIRRPILTGFYELSYQGEGYDVHFELRHQGKRNDTGGRLPGHSVVNLGAGFELTENIDIRAKINNLTDKQYVQAAAWPNADTAAYPGAERTYSVAIDYRF